MSVCTSSGDGNDETDLDIQQSSEPSDIEAVVLRTINSLASLNPTSWMPNE
jgi:hypothetical protein